jgi:hypothetical protein
MPMPRALAATVIVLVAAGCSPNASTPFVAPPQATATPSPVPTATPPGATPTPDPTATPTATPVATATPTPTPTPTPAAAVVPNPAAVALTGIGPSYTLGVNVTQAGYAGSFSQTNTCAGVATVAPAVTQPASPTFSLTPLATGTCALTVTGGSNQSVVVPVTVTSSGLVVSGRRNQR